MAREPKRVTDYRAAIGERDMYSYYAISQLAKVEGIGVAEWSDKYKDGLPDELAQAYDKHMEQAARWHYESLVYSARLEAQGALDDDAVD